MDRRLVGLGCLLWIGCASGCGGGGGEGSGRTGGAVSGGELRLRLAGQVVTRAPSSLVSLPFFVEKANGDPVPGLVAGDFRILEDGEEHSLFESTKRISLDERDFATYTLLLLDLSDSIRRSGAYGQLIPAAESLVKILLDSDGGEVHRVGVWWFDGSAEIQNALDVEEFSKSREAILSALAHLPASRDRSTNLNGAVIQGLQLLDRTLKAAPEEIKRANLVLFTDGSDNAGRRQPHEAIRAIETFVPPNSAPDDRPMRAFTIGLVGETDEAFLDRIGRTRFEPAENATELEQTFAAIAQRIRDQANSFYLLEYCSPKRAGVHNLEVELVHEEAVGFLLTRFDATGFTATCPIESMEVGVDVLGGPGADGVSALAIDEEDRRVLAGSFDEDLPIGSLTLATAGGTTGFVARLSPADEPPLRVDWAVPIGGTPDVDVEIHDVSLPLASEGGGAVVAGTFRGTLHVVKKGGGAQTATSVGAGDGFVARIDDQGEIVWLEALSSDGTCEARAVTAKNGGSTGAGEIFVAGLFSGTARFRGLTPLPSAGGTDAFLLRLDGLGAPQWIRVIETPADDEARAVAQASAGSVLVAGAAGAAFRPKGVPLIESAEFPVGFVAEFQADGTRTWIASLGNPAAPAVPGTSTVRSIDADDRGHVFVAGSLDAGDAPISSGSTFTTFGKDDAFVAKYVIRGSLRWSAIFGGAENDEVHSLVVDANGDVALTGTFRDRANLHGPVFSASGGADAFFLRLSGNDGRQLVTPLAFGGTQADVGAAVAIDSQDDAHVSGSFSETASFFDRIEASEDGSRDIFLLRVR